MKAKSLLCFMVLAVLLTGCGDTVRPVSYNSSAKQAMSYNNYDEGVAYDMAEPMNSASVGMSNNDYIYTPSSDRMDKNKKFIRHVRVDVEIENSETLQDTVNYMVDLASTYNGYVSYSSAEMNSGYDYGRVVLNIPKDKVDELLLSVQDEDSFEVTGIEDSYDDVTEQYTDVESRLHMKEVARDKYMAMLEDAESMEDIINIQRELNMVLEDLEAQQAQMNRLDNKIEFTEITVNVDSKYNVTRRGVLEEIGDGIINIVENIYEPFLTGIAILICGAILIVLSCPIVYLSIRLVVFSIHTKIPFKRKKKKESNEDVK